VRAIPCADTPEWVPASTESRRLPASRTTALCPESLSRLLEGVREAVGVGSGFDDGSFEGQPVNEPWVGEGFGPTGE
jgi:hypothetical protein